jgi:hypothetical protein
MQMAIPEVMVLTDIENTLYDCIRHQTAGGRVRESGRRKQRKSTAWIPDNQ